ncbi:MAG: hypothetical protein JWP12_1795 [Bacteroidetes bacterium]|nr:hypothetical protein [Bacteroidota bacterium]
MKKLLAITVIAMLLIVSSCKKGPGEGGNSTIVGKVWVKDYNSDFTIFNGEYAGADEDVYIIYGDDVSYGDKLKSGPDGVFEFKYLRPGKYKVYVYSKDRTQVTVSNMVAVSATPEITKKKQTVDAGTLQIYN